MLTFPKLFLYIPEKYTIFFIVFLNTYLYLMLKEMAKSVALTSH